MELNEEQQPNAQEEQREHKNDTKPNAYRVDDDGTNEASLRKNYGMGGEMKDANAPGMEGEGMGGHNFGDNNHPPTGDDPANPSRNAGYSNAYLAKTEPSEERPENNNFKSQEQQGEPDYQTAKSTTPNEQDSKQEQQEQVGQQDKNAPEVAGPSEVPEQQKVGGA